MTLLCKTIKWWNNGEYKIWCTNRNFSFCSKALIKVRSARTVFLKEGILIDEMKECLLGTLSYLMSGDFFKNFIITGGIMDNTRIHLSNDQGGCCTTILSSQMGDSWVI